MNRSLVFFIGVIMLGAAANVLADLADECDKKWGEYSSARNGPNGFDYKNLLLDWQKLSSHCKETGIYEIRLAATYLQLGETLKSKQALKSVKIPETYKPLGYTVELNIDLIEALGGEFIDTQKIIPVEQKGLEMLSQYPDHLPLYSMVGHLQIMLEKYEQSIPVLEKAVEYRGGNLLGPYRNLGIAYAYSGNYEKAIINLDEAYKLNKSITDDEIYMYALAISYAAVGKLKSTEDVINLIVAKKPYIEKDAKFKEAIEIIRKVAKTN